MTSAWAAVVKQALGHTNDQPSGVSSDDPIPINVLSLRIAGFNDVEITELVQKGGGNAALE